jgi:hypothetical protein
MRINKFLKHIGQLNEDELREELKLLYNKLDAVKKFYKFELGSKKDKEKYYQKVKANIQSKFATRSYRKPRRPRIQKLNSLLSQLKKDVVFEYELIDIYLFTTETAINFMYNYYFQSEPLFNLISNSFRTACLLIESNLMQEKYKLRTTVLYEKIKLNKAIASECREAFESCFN